MFEPWSALQSGQIRELLAAQGAAGLAGCHEWLLCSRTDRPSSATSRHSRLCSIAAVHLLRSSDSSNVQPGFMSRSGATPPTWIAPSLPPPANRVRRRRACSEFFAEQAVDRITLTAAENNCGTQQPQEQSVFNTAAGPEVAEFPLKHGNDHRHLYPDNARRQAGK